MENGASPNGRAPIPARLLGVGVRGARSVTKAAGIDRAVEGAAEEAIVAAVESKAVERAMVRVLEGPVLEEAVEGALESEAVKRALLEAMDSELVDEVWRRLLASEEAQQLVERIAEAPEVRAAISAPGVALIEDIGRTIGRIARRLDDRFEWIARKICFRTPRLQATEKAGAVSRTLAMLVDGAFVNLSFTAFFALVTLVANAFGDGSGGSGLAIAVGSATWLGFGAVYLLGFWSLAGQTPGMRFLNIRLELERLPFRRSLRRLAGLGLSVLAFGLRFLGVVFGAQRRGWDDRFAHTSVVYEDRHPPPAPWSNQPRAASLSDSAAPAGPAG